MLRTLEQVGATGLAAVHILLAICVAIHVLLHKRDIAASIGWIGLAWLSPILGSVLYIVFGINRVKRRAVQLRGIRQPRLTSEVRLHFPTNRDHHLDLLEGAGGRITGRRVEQGNAVSILSNGDMAYPSMIAAIRSAKSSIALSSYIFRADDAGVRFIEALIDAARRDVEVRVLIDGIGSGYFHSPTFHRLRRQRVPVCRFMHSLLPWRMPFLNLRSHKKLLAIDGRVAFTGGLNIGGENLVDARPRHPVRDTHFRFEGPIVAQLVQDFAEDWQFASGETLGGNAWLPPLDEVGEAAARVVVSGPDQHVEKIELLILEAVACARHSIKIASPYFLPDEQLITALALAAIRGVEVDIIVPAHNNHFYMDWAMRPQIAPLVSAGCRVWRSPPPFDHSKLLTIDNSWCMIGSANCDVRSLRLNFELNVEVFHAGVVQQLNRLIAARSGVLISAAELDRLALPVKLVNSSARLMLPYL